MAATNGKLLAALREQLGGVSDQAISQRRRRLQKLVPVPTDIATYIVVHREGLRINKYLDSETLQSVAEWETRVAAKESRGGSDGASAQKATARGRTTVVREAKFGDVKVPPGGFHSTRWISRRSAVYWPSPRARQARALDRQRGRLGSVLTGSAAIPNGRGRLFASSKRMRKRTVKSLTSQRELTDAQAGQIAWASFPFNDKKRPTSREFEKAVRALSWEFFRGSKGSGLDATHSQATEYLGRFADLAARHGEPYYGPVYKGLVQGDVPAL